MTIELLPVDVEGKTILDIGCWEGTLSLQCLSKGAKHAIGIDMCVGNELKENINTPNFEFYQMELSGEKFLQLPVVDIVFCLGVLYHVEDVFNTLVRLQSKTRETLVLETVFHTLNEEHPLMLFHAGDSLKNNPSNWWSVNKLCMTQMLETLGFTEIKYIPREVFNAFDDKGNEYTRMIVTAKNTNTPALNKVHPRKLSKMEVFGGNRI